MAEPGTPKKLSSQQRRSAPSTTAGSSGWSSPAARAAAAALTENAETERGEVLKKCGFVGLNNVKGVDAAMSFLKELSQSPFPTALVRCRDLFQAEGFGALEDKDPFGERGRLRALVPQERVEQLKQLHSGVRFEAMVVRLEQYASADHAMGGGGRREAVGSREREPHK